MASVVLAVLGVTGLSAGHLLPRPAEILRNPESFLANNAGGEPTCDGTQGRRIQRKRSSSFLISFEDQIDYCMRILFLIVSG